MMNIRFIFVIFPILFCAAPVPTAVAKDYSWEFNNPDDLEGWKLDGFTDKGDIANGTLKATATRGNPHIFSPGVEIDAANQGSIIFSMKLGKGIRSKGCLLFITEDQPNYSDEAQVIFNLKADGEMHEYEVDMGKNPLWKGKVIQLRFQPFFVQWPLPEEQRTVEIDWFRVPDLNEPKK
ncbi:MAG: hypothetical protein HY360_04335 [Verrucomicrobia bacterium]|nr:hypothetical protein [Verrucomicrobiota bacterium]